MSQPEISIVIRTFNEEKFLPDLLEALKKQVYQNFETIVVDSGSMDRTREIAARKADKLLPIESHDFTFGHSLNVGIQAASGKYIAIVSAHTLPFNADWLGKLIEPLHDNDTAMVEHEATTSKVGEDQIFYLNQRGISTEDAVNMIVNGFCKEVFNELPMEFAVEAQKLLAISLEGSVG